MDRAQQQQQAPSTSPVARSDPDGSSNNNMWLMWEKTSRMRVEMLHASPSPRRQLKLLQLHLHFQLQFCKSYAKTAEGRARSALATWLWLFFFGLTYLANFALGTKQFTLCSQWKKVSRRWRKGTQADSRRDSLRVGRLLIGLLIICLNSPRGHRSSSSSMGRDADRGIYRARLIWVAGQISASQMGKQKVSTVCSVWSVCGMRFCVFIAMRGLQNY